MKSSTNDLNMIEKKRNIEKKVFSLGRNCSSF